MLSIFIVLTFYYLTVYVLTFYPVDFLSFWLFSYLLLSVWLFAAWLFVRRLFPISTFYLFDLLPFDFQRRRLFTSWFYVRWLSVRLPFTFRLFTLEPAETATRARVNGYNKYMYFNPRPYPVFRHLRQWSRGAILPGDRLLMVVELRGKQSMRLDEISRFHICFGPRATFDLVRLGQRSHFRENDIF